MADTGEMRVEFAASQLDGAVDARALRDVLAPAREACSGMSWHVPPDVAADMAGDPMAEVLALEAQCYLASFVDAVISGRVMTTNPTTWLTFRHAVQSACRIVAMPGCGPAAEAFPPADLVDAAAAAMGAIAEAADPRAFALMRSGGGIGLYDAVLSDLTEGRGAVWFAYASVMGEAASAALGLQWAGLVSGYGRGILTSTTEVAGWDDVTAFAGALVEPLETVSKSLASLSAASALKARAAGASAKGDAENVRSLLGIAGDASDDGTGYCGLMGVTPLECVSF